jgi:hypothetical protein
MSITLAIELTDDEAARIKARAQAEGKAVEEVIRRMIADMPALPERQREAVALLDSWIAEDAAMSEDERHEADREWEDFQANMNANRVLEGRSAVYP